MVGRMRSPKNSVLEDEAEITQVQNGQADWLFDPPPADRLAELGARNSGQVHLNPALAIWYVALNTRLPPFNDRRVRQALNAAVNRDCVGEAVWRTAHGHAELPDLAARYAGLRALLSLHA